jgi:hypothetical protein
MDVSGLIWPNWVIWFRTFITKLLDWLLSFFPSYPGVDVQALANIAGGMPFLFFSLLWRYFSNSHGFPFSTSLMDLFSCAVLGVFAGGLARVIVDVKSPGGWVVFGLGAIVLGIPILVNAFDVREYDIVPRVL